GPALGWSPRSRNELDHFIWHQSHCFAYLMFLRRPCQDSTDLVQQALAHSAGLHYMRLLTQVLGYQHPGIVERPSAVVIQRADYELRPINMRNAATGSFCTGSQVRHCLLIVGGGDQVVQQDSVSYLS